MTENELRQRVLDQAKLWLGCKEADGSHRKIIDTYNQITPLPRNYRMTYCDPWCAAFVSAVGQALGMSSVILPECGCDPMIAKYKAAGLWHEEDDFVPKEADIVFYDWDDSGVGDCTGGSDHVGIVWCAYQNEITVIEGNCSDMVCFTSRKVNGRYIRGFATPDYASLATENEVVVIEDPAKQPVTGGSPEPGTTATVTLPVLMIGDGGPDSNLEEAVRAMQHMLEKRGFRCGWMGADGEFGDKTQSALGKFQLAYGLEHDGICKGKDWAVLILGVNKHE